MDFHEYLKSKNIDPTLFLQKEAEVFREWEQLFQRMHVKSFTMQKLNLINPIRRKYRLQTVQPSASEKVPTNDTPAVRMAKPNVKPKPKTT